MLSETHNDVARFEITVNEVARMYVLQATELTHRRHLPISRGITVSAVEFTHQLPSQKQYGLGREHKVTLNKEVPKRLAEAIDRHRIITRFRTKPMDTRDTGPSLKLSVDIKLIA
jgi:hypothetical protein